MIRSNRRASLFANLIFGVGYAALFAIVLAPRSFWL